MGVVYEAEVLTPLKSRAADDAHETYSNGKKADWAWVAETGKRTLGFLPRERVNEILGYKSNYRFRGFNNGRGIIRLEPQVYANLMAAFTGAG